MFSVLGARLLIEEVHAKSRAAAAVGSILRRTRIARRRRGSGGSSSSEDSSSTISSSDAPSLARTVSSASSAASSLSCELVCGAAGCRGLCADSASELAEADELAAALASGAAAGLGSACGGGSSGTSRLQRCSSAWSTASTASIAAFAADASCGAAASDRGASLVPMFPAGRILWLLPPQTSTATACTAIGGGGGVAPLGVAEVSNGGGQPAPPQLVETDQSAFERFLFTTETATVHLPDFYIRAIDAVAAASPAS